MSFCHAGCAKRACAPVFRKTPPHVHPIINMAADVCPVFPKVHPSRNLNSMGSSLWSQFEKECPFAKVVQKNFAGNAAPSSSTPALRARPVRTVSRKEYATVAAAHAKPAVKPIQAAVEQKSATKPSTSKKAHFSGCHCALRDFLSLLCTNQATEELKMPKCSWI